MAEDYIRERVDQELLSGIESLFNLRKAIESDGEVRAHVASGVKHLQSIINKPTAERIREGAMAPRRFAMMPYGYMGWGGTGRGLEKPIYYHSVPLLHLRAAAKQVALLRSIHSVIERDLKQFAKRAVRDGDVGYKIEHKCEHEQSFNPTKQEQAINDIKKQHIYDILEMPDPQFAKTFHNFVTKILADHLDIDRIAIGVTYKLDPEYHRLSGKMERPVAFTPIDGTTIKPVEQYVQQFLRQEGIRDVNPSSVRRAKDKLSQQFYRDMKGKTRASDFFDLAYVQERSGSLVNYFTEDEIMLGIGNPRPDLGWYGYGESYVERSISVILAFTYAFTYNVRQFEDGVLPEGMVAVIGEYTQEGMEAFRDRLRMQTSGTPHNMNRTPFFHITSEASKQGAGIKWVPFRAHNKDMLFHEWMQMVTALACANYSLPIEKLQMGKFNAGGSQLSSEGGFHMQQMREFSYLRGYLYFFKSLMDEVVRKIYPDFVFEWEGIRPDDEERKLDLIAKRTHLTLDEIRSRDGLEPYDTVVEEMDVGGANMKDVAKTMGSLIPHPQFAQINQQIVQNVLTPQEAAPEEGGLTEGGEGGEGEGEDLEALMREVGGGKEKSTEGDEEDEGGDGAEEAAVRAAKGISKSVGEPIANARFKRS